MADAGAAAMDAISTISALRATRLFSRLEEPQLQELSAASRVRELLPRQRLWSHGEAADLMGVIVTGRVVMGRRQRGRDVIIEVLGPGDLVGEVGLTLRATHHFDVHCLRKARVLLVPTALFRRQLERCPKASAALALDLAQLVVKLTRRLEALNGGNVEQRLARVVASLADRFGEPFAGGVLVPLKLRRQDLASLAATTLESTSRRLSSWKAQGIVVPQPAGLLVRDPAALRRIIG